MKQLILSLLLLLPMPIFATETLRIGINEDLLAKYTMFVGDRDVLQITDFSGEGTRRSVVEVVLLVQALHLGGMDSPIEWRVLPNYSRIQRALQEGDIAIAASSMWNYDLVNMLKYTIASDALVADGEYQAGLYKLANNPLTIITPEELNNLTVISVASWTPDWTTLTSMPFKAVFDANNWDAMIRMIQAQRGDVILSSFKGSADMSFSEGDVTLIPVDGVKVSLMGSRHFVIAKQHPNSADILLAVNKGLSQLRNDGIVRKAFTESGFFNERVTHWLDLRL